MKLSILGLLFLLGFTQGQDVKAADMIQWTTSRSVVKLDAEKFRSHVRSPSKSYGVFVMFTAMNSRRGCSICREAKDEFTILANSWHYLSQEKTDPKLFFAIADFDEGMDSIFQEMDLKQVPAFFYYPAKGKPKPSDTYDLSRAGYDAEPMGKWLSDRTGLNVRVFRPPNYSGTLAMIAMVVVVGVLLYIKRSSLQFLFNRHSWGVTVCVIIFTFISGQMWNQIRGPPFMHRDRDGNTGYFSGSSQYQFVAETYIVFFMYMAMTIGVVILDQACGEVDSSKQKIFGVAGLGLLVYFFSLMLSYFRAKNGGYPYSFLFK